MAKRANADDPEATPAATVGRIVHFVLDDGPNKGRHAAAIVVRVWPNNSVNLQVFPDGDGTPHANDGLAAPLWRCSVPYEEPVPPAEDVPDLPATPRTWHWPERD